MSNNITREEISEAIFNDIGLSKSLGSSNFIKASTVLLALEAQNISNNLLKELNSNWKSSCGEMIFKISILQLLGHFPSLDRTKVAPKFQIPNAMISE